GVSGVFEGVTGRDLVTAQALSTEERSSLLGEGLVGVAAIAYEGGFGAGPKGKLPPQLRRRLAVLREIRTTDQLPHRCPGHIVDNKYTPSGKKTQGLLYGLKTPVGEENTVVFTKALISGEPGPARTLESPFFNENFRTHVEGHASAYMRETGSHIAILEIN